MGNLTEPGSGFRVAAPNHPEALLEEPQAFQAVGEKLNTFSNNIISAEPVAEVSKEKTYRIYRNEALVV